MINITVLENFEANNLVEIEFEGEVNTREMTNRELYATIQDARKGLVNVHFEEPTLVHVVTLEDYDNEFDVTLNTYTFSTLSDFTFDNETVKTYKRENSAYKKMVAVANQYDCFYEVSNC